MEREVCIVYRAARGAALPVTSRKRCVTDVNLYGYGVRVMTYVRVTRKVRKKVRVEPWLSSYQGGNKGGAVTGTLCVICASSRPITVIARLAGSLG